MTELPPPHPPGSPPSLVLLSHHPSSQLPFPLPSPPVPLFPPPSPCSSSLHFPSTLFFITSGPFPRASARSPWWLKGRPIAVSCRVKVKVLLCLSAANPSIYSCSLLTWMHLLCMAAGCVQKRYLLLHFFPLLPLCHLFFFKRYIFEVSISKHHRWLQLPLQLSGSYWCIQKSDFILLLASIISNPFDLMAIFDSSSSSIIVAGAEKHSLAGAHWEIDENVNMGTWMLLWAVLDCCWGFRMDKSSGRGWRWAFFFLQCCYSASSPRPR